MGDLMIDVALDDLAAARDFLSGEVYRTAMAAVVPAILAEATAHATYPRRRR